MEKIKTRGQGGVKKAVTRCLLIANCYLLFACANPADPPQTVAPPESGYGTVSVAFTDGLARTVFPVTVFDSVFYAFARTDGSPTPAEIEPVNGVYTLPAGAWKVTVTAYKGAVSESNKAAAGELNFNVADGEHKQIRVPLSAAKETGMGKFSYGIQYPEDAVAAITLVSLAEPPANDDGSYDPAVTLYPETSDPLEGNKISSQTEFELDAGLYLLSVQLTLGPVMRAGKNEVVLVYDKLTSEFGTAENPIVFTMEDFALPAVPDVPVPTVSPGTAALFVSWPEVNLATTYEVWYGPSDSPSEPQKWGDDISATSTTITGLTIGTAYDVHVRAKNRMGNTESATAASGTPFALRLCDGANLATPLDNLASTPGATPLDKAFNWIAAHAELDAEYAIILGADETQGPKTLNAGSVNNQTGVVITLKGDGQERTIQLSGNGSLYSIGAANLKLVLGANITLRGTASNNNPLVSVGSNGMLVMEEGSKIVDNTNVSTAYGGGVYVTSSTFIMNGGIITGNKQSNNVMGSLADRSGGGGVRLRNNGTFIMNAGEISGNTALNGGGVYVNKGGSTGPATFTMNGGKIFNNTATTSGGGVGVENTSSSIFTMTGGKIFGNNVGSNNFGGGVAVLRDAIFKKQPAEGETESGVIYGYDAEDELQSNVVGTFASPASSKGHAVYKSDTQRREKTVTASQSLDSAQAGSAGGWTE